MAPSCIAPPPPHQGDGQDLARAIEAMAAALTQQSNAMLQQHEAAMQRQEASLEQQHLVMQQMEATRQAPHDAQRSHMDALRQLGENAAGAQMHGPHPQPPPPECSLEDFLKHQPAKFDGKTSPDQADQWMKDMERIFNAKRCPNESRLAFTVYMLTGDVEHW